MPEDRRETLGKWLDRRRRDVPAIRWVSPETLHITLKFYGEIQLDMIEGLKKHLAAIKRKGPFELGINGVNGFPTLSAPNTVWTGVKTDISRLMETAREVELASLKIGIDRNRRRLRPHITLGRRTTQEPLSAEVMELLLNDPPVVEPWLVEAIMLTKSELFPDGPKYSPMGIYKI